MTIGETRSSEQLRHCFRDPIPEIADAARYLDAAVSAHLAGQRNVAEELVRLADIPAIRAWTESIWGRKSLYVHLHRPKSQVSLVIAGATRNRMPTSEEMRALHRRDGFHCRFCGIPVMRKEVRVRIKAVYPSALHWGRTNAEQHAAFQAMWAQYDHVVPHARGGTNELSNLVVTCAPCNFGRMNYLLEEVGLIDPRTRNVVSSPWEGLERFR